MFIESPRFPDDISLGVSGGPEFVTDLASNAGGYRVATATRDLPLHKFDAAHGVRTHDQFLILKRLFMNTRGRWAGFRFKDWADFSYDVTTGVLVTLAPGVFQLTNQYVYGAVTYQRPLRKPVVGTTKIYRDASLAVAGSAAGQYALDTTTGIVTFVPDGETPVATITKGTSTVLHLNASLGPVAVLSVTGFTGADAALLNDQTFAVLGISGTDYTLGVDTTGKDVIASTSIQPRARVFVDTSHLTASGEFDLPVAFDTDFMQASMDYSKRLHTWGQIPLIELRNPG